MSIFGTVKRIRDWNHLGYSLSRVEKAMKREAEMQQVPYNPAITTKKAVRGIAEGALAVVVSAILAYLTDSAALSAALERAGVGDAVTVALVPVLVGLARAAVNRIKHVG